MAIRNIKSPNVIKDLNGIIERLLTEEVTTNSIAAEYKTTRSTVQYHIKKNTTVTQYEAIRKRGYEVAGRKRCGGRQRRNSKAMQFGETYADPLFPVKHRIIRPGFEVQTKDADGKWYTIDTPSCEDAAVLLLAALYNYDIID